jgi:hypothetical protein
MKTLTPISVESYAGHKADEYPKSFTSNDKKYFVIEIKDRWYQNDYNPEWPVSDYFKVVTDSGEEFILKHETKKGTWWLIEG